MKASATLETRKKDTAPLTLSRGVESLLRFSYFKGTDGAQPSMLEAKRGERVDPYFNHDFSRIPAQGLSSHHQALQPENQSCPLALSDSRTCPFGGACHICPARVQTKLSLNQPGDEYEQEADRVADTIMRMPEPQMQRKGCLPCNSMDEEELIQAKIITERITPLAKKQNEEGTIQTKYTTPLSQSRESLVKEKGETSIQARTDGGLTPEVTPAIRADIQSLQGGGRPLSVTERCFFEPRFGADFSDVRLHDDERANSTAGSINARAFTLGSNVVFSKGEYSPNTSSGRKLLAHELTHVVQQNGGLTLSSPGKKTTNALYNHRESNTLSTERTEHKSTHIAQQKAVLLKHQWAASGNNETQVQKNIMRMGTGGQVMQCAPGGSLMRPGVCSWSRYISLRGAVEAAKTVVRTLGACTAVDNCLTLAIKIAAVTAEIAARVAINTICFLGGDRGHLQQVQDKVNMLNRCYQFFVVSNCPQELMEKAREAVRRALEIVAMAMIAVMAVVALIAAIILLVKAIIAAGAVAVVAAGAAAVIALLILIRDQISSDNPPTA